MKMKSIVEFMISGYMDTWTIIARCDDGSCCCIPHRSMVALISIISLIACVLDMVTNDSPTQYADCTLVSTQVECAKQLLVTLFQMANLLLLLASMVESAILVQLYVWYTLGFVVMGLIVAIVDLLFRYKTEGTSSFVGFTTEVCFLFVILRCLPLVDTYRKHLDGESSITA